MARCFLIFFILALPILAHADLAEFIRICENAPHFPERLQTLAALQKNAAAKFADAPLSCSELGARLQKTKKLYLPGHTFHYYKVPDVSPIAALDWLEDLSIPAQQVNSLGPLQNLKKLKRLDITDVQADLSFLAALPVLENLRFTARRQDPLDVLRFLPLKSLELSTAEEGVVLRALPYSLTQLKIQGNGVIDYAGLENLHLKEISLSGIKVADFSWLKGSKYTLEKAHIENSQVADLRALSECSRLNQLEFISSGLTLLDFLERMHSLEILDLKSNLITDVHPLQNLRNLKKLSLYDNRISEASSLTELFKLEDLDLGHNVLYRFSLGYLERLRTLNLSQNHLAVMAEADISDARYRLEKLLLNGNDIRAVHASVENLKNLRVLALGSNKLNKVDGLEVVGSLEELYLDDNKLTDISILSKLTKLKKLRLWDNPLPLPIRCPVQPETVCQ